MRFGGAAWRVGVGAALAAVAVVVVPPAWGADGVGAPGAGDPYFPLAGNGGYDVSNYDLTLD